MDDRITRTEMIAEIDPSLQVISVDNGTGVVQHLKTLAHTHVLTCFILLDVNRPGDGWVSTLERVKKHESFSSIPVFVFTTSRYVRDSNWPTRLWAEKFISKPFR